MNLKCTFITLGLVVSVIILMLPLSNFKALVFTKTAGFVTTIRMRWCIEEDGERSRYSAVHTSR